jgi:hypothetical protein
MKRIAIFIVNKRSSILCQKANECALNNGRAGIYGSAISVRFGRFGVYSGIGFAVYIVALTI